jgi:hypothetical protein
MYVSDPNLTVPADDAWLWRYQSFDKFMLFLEAGALWFSRADQFYDPFEVAVPDKDLPAARTNLFESVRAAGADDFVQRWLARFGGTTIEELKALPDGQLASLLPRFANHFAYVSCWQRNDTESAGLWAQYAPGNGVAVRTTSGTLRQALDTGSGGYNVALGEVHYLDYHTESWGPYHQFSATFHKRRSFSYEQEVRAVISWPQWDDVIAGSVDPASMPDLRGIAIPVDLSQLLHSVVISPNATGWFADLVASVVDRYGLSHAPVVSELTEQPAW